MERSCLLHDTVHQFKDLISCIWGKEKPLCILFSTSKNKYLYDAGSSKILKCGNLEYNLLDCLLASGNFDSGLNKFLLLCSKEDASVAISNLAESIDRNNILKLTKVQNFGLSHEPSSVIDKAYNDLSIMILEVTQSCNLRCRYCIYNEGFSQNRNHSYAHMTQDIGTKAIDHLRYCSNSRKEVSIGFYGGEPLLKYDLIKKIVSYAHRVLSNKEIKLSLTTNGTLINNEIADFLAHENFSVLVSIDGPEEIHDLWRRDVGNKGSFKQAFAGLKLLANKYSHGSHNIGLSVVYAPPYSVRKLELIYDFISSVDWLPKDIKIVITYPHNESLPDFYHSDKKISKHSKYDFSLSDWTMKKFFSCYITGTQCDPITSSIVETRLARLIQRPILEYVTDMSQLNGCCYPASRRIYITAKGTMKLCERIGRSPDIGNVFEGIYPEIIKSEYIAEYSSKSIEDCSHCWLTRLCPICYQQAFYDNDIDINRKRAYCDLQKLQTVKDLSYYCSLREINEHGLDYLYEWELK